MADGGARNSGLQLAGPPAVGWVQAGCELGFSRPGSAARAAQSVATCELRRCYTAHSVGVRYFGRGNHRAERDCGSQTECFWLAKSLAAPSPSCGCSGPGSASLYCVHVAMRGGSGSPLWEPAAFHPCDRKHSVARAGSNSWQPVHLQASGAWIVPCAVLTCSLQLGSQLLLNCCTVD